MEGLASGATAKASGNNDELLLGISLQTMDKEDFGSQATSGPQADPHQHGVRANSNQLPLRSCICAVYVLINVHQLIVFSG